MCRVTRYDKVYHDQRRVPVERREPCDNALCRTTRVYDLGPQHVYPASSLDEPSTREADRDLRNGESGHVRRRRDSGISFRGFISQAFASRHETPSRGRDREREANRRSREVPGAIPIHLDDIVYVESRPRGAQYDDGRPRTPRAPNPPPAASPVGRNAANLRGGRQAPPAVHQPTRPDRNRNRVPDVPLREHTREAPGQSSPEGPNDAEFERLRRRYDHERQSRLDAQEAHLRSLAAAEAAMERQQQAEREAERYRVELARERERGQSSRDGAGLPRRSGSMHAPPRDSRARDIPRPNNNFTQRRRASSRPTTRPAVHDDPPVGDVRPETQAADRGRRVIDSSWADVPPSPPGRRL